jgi:hypothetical protein
MEHGIAKQTRLRGLFIFQEIYYRGTGANMSIIKDIF